MKQKQKTAGLYESTCQANQSLSQSWESKYTTGYLSGTSLFWIKQGTFHKALLQVQLFLYFFLLLPHLLSHGGVQRLPFQPLSLTTCCLPSLATILDETRIASFTFHFHPVASSIKLKLLNLQMCWLTLFTSRLSNLFLSSPPSKFPFL